MMAVQPDYTSPLWPEETRALYQDFVDRYPDLVLYNTALSGFVSVNMFVKAVQQAGTTDTDAVLAVFDDPNFTFDYFGYKSDAKLGGYEYYGVHRVLPIPWPFAVMKDGKMVQMAIDWIEVP